jgi:hypothetical protein
MMETHIWTFINETVDLSESSSILGWSLRAQDNEVRLYMNGWSVYGD